MGNKASKKLPQEIVCEERQATIPAAKEPEQLFEQETKMEEERPLVLEKHSFPIFTQEIKEIDTRSVGTHATVIEEKPLDYSIIVDKVVDEITSEYATKNEYMFLLDKVSDLTKIIGTLSRKIEDLEDQASCDRQSKSSVSDFAALQNISSQINQQVNSPCSQLAKISNFSTPSKAGISKNSSKLIGSKLRLARRHYKKFKLASKKADRTNTVIKENAKKLANT